MDARTLNLEEAFRLASLLSKHVDVKKLDPQQDAVDFISDLVESLSPEEYMKCVELVTGEDEHTIKKEVSLEILTCFIEGMKLNNIVSLLHFYKMLGL
jgi:hypothetical protein